MGLGFGDGMGYWARGWAMGDLWVGVYKGLRFGVGVWRWDGVL